MAEERGEPAADLRATGGLKEQEEPEEVSPLFCLQPKLQPLFLLLFQL